jgi:hypothetical protein
MSNFITHNPNMHKTASAKPTTSMKWEDVTCYDEVLLYIQEKFPHYLPQLQVALAQSIEQAVKRPQSVSTEFLESMGYGHKDENHHNYRWNPLDELLEQQRVAL